MERGGRCIRAIPSAGALENESLVFIGEGRPGFHSPPSAETKAAIVAGESRPITRPRLQGGCPEPAHTARPLEQPLRAVPGRCSARSFGRARTTPDTHGPTSAVPRWGQHPRETAREEQAAMGTHLFPPWCSPGAGVWWCCSPRAASSAVTVTTGSNNKCDNMPRFDKNFGVKRSFVTHRSPNLKQSQNIPKLSKILVAPAP